MMAATTSSVPHTFGSPDGSDVPAAERTFIRLGPFAFCEAFMGAGPHTTVGDDARAYRIYVPLTGRMEATHRDVNLTLTPRLAGFRLPVGEYAVNGWAAGTRVLTVAIDRSALDAALRRRIGDLPDQQIPFTFGMDLAGAPGTWVRFVRNLYRRLGSRSASLLTSDLATTRLSESLLNGLLLITDHPYRERFHGPAEQAPSGAVSDAVDLMERNPEHPWTVSELAGRCRVSVRTLHKNFQHQLNTTPMAHLRVVRLRRVHQELRSASLSQTTVTAVATRWGFHHMSHFSAVYAHMFDEYPHTTLRTP